MTTSPDHTPLIDEQLSAWLDDELPREEQELLATRLARSPEYQARVAHYGLISSCLRGGLGGGHGDGESGTLSSQLEALRLADRVRIALDEPAAPERQPARVRANRALPYAMAAGLAVVAGAFAVFQGPLWHPVAAPVPVAGVVDPVQLSAGSRPGAAGQASLSSTRLTSYLVYHGEYSGLLAARVTASHIVNNSPNAAFQETAERLPNP